MGTLPALLGVGTSDLKDPIATSTVRSLVVVHMLMLGFSVSDWIVRPLLMPGLGPSPSFHVYELPGSEFFVVALQLDTNFRPIQSTSLSAEIYSASGTYRGTFHRPMVAFGLPSNIK